MQISIDLANTSRRHVDALRAALDTMWPQTAVVDLRLTNDEVARLSEIGRQRADLTGDQLRAAYGVAPAAGFDPKKSPESNAADLDNAIFISQDDNPETGHGSAELDADAAYLEAVAGPGAAGATLSEVFGAGAPLPINPPPPAASAPAPNPGPVAKLDKNGLPWDQRIHASSRALNADGTWRQRRNLGGTVLETVTAQLKAAMAAPAPAVATQGADAPMTDDPAHAGYAQSFNGVPAAPPAPAPSAAPLAPPPPVSAGPVVVGAATSAPAANPGNAQPAGAPVTPHDFASFVKFVTPLKASGKLSQVQIEQAIASVGLPPSVPMLANRPDLIAQVHAVLVRLVGVV